MRIRLAGLMNPSR